MANQGKGGTSKQDHRLGVRVVVEFTGKIPRNKLIQLSTAVGSVLKNHMENGGGGQ